MTLKLLRRTVTKTLTTQHPFTCDVTVSLTVKVTVIVLMMAGRVGVALINPVSWYVSDHNVNTSTNCHKTQIIFTTGTVTGRTVTLRVNKPSL